MTRENRTKMTAERFLDFHTIDALLRNAESQYILSIATTWVVNKNNQPVRHSSTKNKPTSPRMPTSPQENTEEIANPIIITKPIPKVKSISVPSKRPTPLIEVLYIAFEKEAVPPRQTSEASPAITNVAK